MIKPKYTKEEKKQKIKEWQKKNPMFVPFDNYTHLIDLINRSYNTTIKDACKALKCSRSWVNRFIKPHLHFVYVPKNFTLALYNCSHLTAIKNYEGDQVFFNTKEFIKLVRGNLTPPTRQAATVPLLAVVKDKEKVIKVCEEAMKEQSISPAAAAENQRKALDIYNDTIANNILPCVRDEIASPYQRKKTKPVTVDFDKSVNVLTDLEAVHDIKDYGDTDEKIYSKLFCESYYRTELHLPDKNGEMSKKIYYVDLPWSIRPGWFFKDYTHPSVDELSSRLHRIGAAEGFDVILTFKGYQKLCEYYGIEDY